MNAHRIVVEAKLRQHRFRPMRGRPGVWRRRLGRRFVARVTDTDLELTSKRGTITVHRFHQSTVDVAGELADRAINRILSR